MKNRMKERLTMISAWSGLLLGFFASSALAGEIVSAAQSVQRPTRVACVGDSLTTGFKMEHPEMDAYPAQLARLLGTGWDVKAFAVPGRTALRDTALPLWKEKVFADALAWQPDVVIICLGTNDSWPEIWHRLSGSFPGDYRGMIDRFAELPSHPRIWLCLPPPLFIENGEEQKNILAKEIIPIINRIGHESHCEVIDWYTPLLSHRELFMDDKVHPLPTAASLMAKAVAKAIQGSVPIVNGSAAGRSLQSESGKNPQ